MKSKAKKLTGRLKQVAGVITGNKELEKQGADQRVAGTVEANIGKTRRKVGKVLEDTGESIKE